MPVIEYSSDQASTKRTHKKRRKVIAVLLLLLFLLGLTFTSVSRFFWNPNSDSNTDPRSDAAVSVIETEDDASRSAQLNRIVSLENSLQALSNVVSDIQENVNSLQNNPVTTPNSDVPPESISHDLYNAYENLQYYSYLDTPGATSILTRGQITNEFLLKTTKLTDISDVNGTGLVSGKILKWDGTEWVVSDDKDTNTTYSASNGLTLSDTTFKLGGSLSGDTEIDLESHSFTFKDGNVTVDNTLYANALYQDGNEVCDISGNCPSSSGSWTMAGDSGTSQAVAPGDTATFVGGAGLSTVASATDTLTFTIGAGTGIAVGANDVGVDQSYAFAWTGTQSWSNTADFNGDVSFADTDIVFDGASTNFTPTGNFSINTNDVFVQKSDGNVGIGNAAPGYALDVTGMINAVNGVRTIDDFYIGSIGLTDTASNITSGAFLVGVFDEFANSSSTTVQGVLNDLDAAIAGSSHSPVTLAGPYTYLSLTGQQITLAQINLTTDVTGILPLANGGTNADLSGVSTGGIIYKGATALAGSGSLTGVLKGNGSSAPTAMTGTQNYVTRWTDANSLGTGILYDNGTNIGISTTTPGAKLDVVGGSVRADGDLIAGDLNLGYDDASATITTSDTDENLTIDPNGTGSLFLHGSTYYIDASGLIYTAGLATTGYTPTAGELRADIFRDGNSSYYLQPADTSISGVFAGNVGIGTTSPDFALQVNGTIAPEVTDQDLGTNALRWNLFANTLNADSTVTLTGLGTGTDNTVLILNGSNQVTTDEIDSRVWGSTLVDGSGTAGYVSYWSDTDTLAAEQYLSVARGGLGNDVTPAGGGEILYSTGTTAYESLPAGTLGYVLVSGGTGAPSWIDSGALGSSYWAKIAGVLSPALGEPIAATTSATTVATFTSHGSNLSLQTGGTSAFATFDNSGNLLLTNGSGSTIDATAGLTIGGTTQTGLILGRSGISTRIANLTTDGVVYTSGTNGTLNTEAQLAIARGGTNTNATPTAGTVAYGSGTAYAFTSVGTTGQALLSAGSGTPTWGTVGLTYGGTNADLSGIATGSIIYKGASALAGSGALTGVLKGNGAGAPTAMTGIQHYVTRWTDANTLGTGVIYDNGTNVGIGTTSPDFALQVNGDIAPETTDEDLGSSTLRWNVFANTLNADSTVTLSGLSSGIDDTILILNASNQVATREIDPGVWGGQLIEGTGTTGYVAYWGSTDTLTAEQYLSVVRGGLGNNLTAAGAGEVLYSTSTTSYDSLAAGNLGYVLSSGGAGAPSWVDPATLGTNYWQVVNGAFSPVTPYTNNADLLVGSNASASAKFAVLNVYPGTTGSPTASVSSGLSGTSMFMTADGTLATTNRKALTIGNSSAYDTTGNVLINPNGTGNVGIGSTAPLNKLDVAGNIDTSGFYKLDNNRILDAISGGSTTIVGISAGSVAIDGANDNTLVGYDAGGNINSTNADGNTLIGAYAGASITSGNLNTIMGTNAALNLTTGIENVVIGDNTNLTNASGQNVVIGHLSGGAGGTGSYNILLGAYSDVTASSNYSLALGANVDIAYSSAIGIGFEADPTAAHQLVVGGNNADGYIDDAYFGRGVLSATPSDIKFNATGGSGTDIAGANFILAGGKATGNADGGDLIFQTADVGSTGATLQSLTEKMRLTDEGNLGIGTSNPASFKLQVAGSIGPQTDDTYDLGSDTARWRDLYLGGETLHIGTSVTDEGTISYNTSTNILGISTDSTTNGDIAFFTDDLYLDKSAGNVGVGTTTPAQALHVIGDVRISGLTASLPVKTNASNDLISGAINLASAEVTGILGLSNGGTNADLSGVSNGGIIYKGAAALEGSGSLTGVLKGNGSSAPTAMTGIQNYVTRWTDANTLGSGVLYDNGTNVGISTTNPASFKLEVAGNIGPTANNTYDLGSNAARWANVYATNFYQAGNAVCDLSGNCAAVGNLWQYANGAISPNTPYTNNSDLLVGSNASASAKFAVLNVYPGTTGSPTASVSSGLDGTSMFMTADGSLSTQNRMSLYVGNRSGNDTTGNVLINSNGTGNVGIGNTGPTAMFTIGSSSQFQVNSSGEIAAIDGVAHTLTDNAGSLSINSNGTKTEIVDDLQVTGNDILDSAAGTRITLGATTTLTNTTTAFSGTSTFTASSLATFTTAASLSMGSTSTLTLASNATINGGTAANDDLTLQGTSNATRTASYVLLQPTAGNVGIGTTAPAVKLQVVGSDLVAIFQGDEVYSGMTTGQLQIRGNTDPLLRLSMGYDTSNAFGWIEAGQQGIGYHNLALAPSGGNVGIGTTIPSRKLSVETSGASSYVKVASFGTGFEGGLILYGPRGTQATPTANAATDVLGSIYFGGFDTAESYGARIYGIAPAAWGGSATDAPTDIRIATAPDGSETRADRMTIQSDGNVGIGTTAPLGGFDFQGSTASGGDWAYFGGNAGGTTPSASRTFGLITGWNSSNGTGETQLLYGSVGGGAPQLQIGAWDGAASTISMVVRGGNVGIGSSANPTSELQIGGTTPELRIGDDGAEDAQLSFMGNATDFHIGLDDSTDLLTIGTGTALGTNAFMVMNTTGNVGIGTTSPGAKLDVGNTTAAVLRLSRNNTGLVATDVAGSLEFWGNDGNDGSLVRSKIDSVVSDALGRHYNLAFSTMRDGVLAEQMRIDKDGNVGIGTTDPASFNLQVNGTVGPQTTDLDLGSSSLRWDLFANTINADSTVTLTGLGTGTDNTVLILNASNQVTTDEIDSRVWGSTLADGSGIANYVARWSDTDTLTTGVIYDSGTNVGIGTTGPSSPLHVQLTNTTYNAASTLLRLSKRGTVSASNTDGAGARIEFASSDIDGNNITVAAIDGVLIDPNYNGGGRRGDLVFSTIPGDIGAMTERMRIDNAGNVGIGTSTPVLRLEVDHGDTTTYSSTSIAGNGALIRNLNNSAAGNTFSTLRMQTSSNNGTNNAQGAINLIQPTNASHDSNFSFQLRNSGGTYTEIMRMLADGNVGIGDTTPSYKLDVLSVGRATSKWTAKDTGTFGEVSLVTGSATLPGYIEWRNPVADGGTGTRRGYMGWSATDVVLTLENSSEFQVTGGNVGIGTTSSGELLHVGGTATAGTGATLGGAFVGWWDGNSSYAAFTHNSLKATTTSYALLQSSSGATFLNAATGQDIALRINNTDVMTIDSTSNVGIGIAAPTSKLYVKNDANSDTVITVNNATVGTAARAVVGASTDTGFTGIYAYSSGYTTSGAQQAAGSLLYSSGTAGLSIAGANSTSGEIRLYTDGLADANERMIITNSGNIGLGTSNPLEKVHMYSTAAYAAMILESSSNANTVALEFDQGSVPKWIFGVPSATDNLAITNPSGSVEAMTITSANNVGIGDTTPDRLLDVKGNVCLDLNADEACTDNTAALSDARLKTNVTNLTGSLDMVQRLRGVRFNWNGVYNTGNAASLGFIAQEVEQIYPELVIEDTAGYKNLDYSKLTAVLAGAIQEQQSQIEGLQQSTGNLSFTSNGDLTVTGQSQQYTVTPVGGSPLATVLGAAQAVVGKITTGLITTKELVVQQSASIASLSVTNLTVSGQSINDYIRNIVQLELQSQPTPLPADAIAQNFNSGMVINNYNTTVTIVQDQNATSSTTFSATGSGKIANYFNVTEVTEVRPDAQFDILATLISWSDAAVDGVRTLFINAPATFKYLAWFQGPVKVNADTSGILMIPANTLKARVSFSKQFPETPTIYVNFSDSAAIGYTITDTNQSGFTINFAVAPDKDLSLQWLALLRGETNDGPSLEVMETGSGAPAILPAATPTPSPATTPNPVVSTSAPATDSGSSPTPDTALSDLVNSGTATDSATPSGTASPSAQTP